MAPITTVNLASMDLNLFHVLHTVLEERSATGAARRFHAAEQNGMTPCCVAAGEHGEVSLNGKTVCYLHIDGTENMPGPWTIWTEGDYSDFPLDENMKEIAWANVSICGKCGGDCAPGSRKTILGKDFDNVCYAVMAFNNPDAKTLECVKKLLS